MKYYDVIRVSNQNTSFDVVGGEVGIGKDNNGSYVIINDKKIYGLSRIEHICQVKVVNEQDQKKLKAFEIVKEKGLSINDIAFIRNGESWETYVETMKQLYWGDEHLDRVLKTQEEYDLLKELLK